MIGRLLLQFFLCFTLLGIAGQALADNTPQPLLITDAHSNNYPVYSHLSVLEDPNNSVSIDTLLSDKYAGHFKAITQTPPNYGLTTSTYWFRLNIKNMSDHILPLLLELQNPRIQSAQLYISQNNQLLTSEKLGIAQPFSNRKFNYRNPVFELSLPVGKEQTLYLRTKTDTLHLVPLSLSSPLSFFEQKNSESYILGIFIGALLFAAGYNFILSLSIKNRSYFFYISYVCGFLMYQISMDGLAYQYLWPNSPDWGLIAPLILVLFTLVSAYYFTASFLMLRTEIPWLHVLLNRVAIFLIALVFLPLVAEYQFATKIISVAGWGSILLLLVSGVIAYKRGIYMARFYVLAWSVLLLSILISELRFWGVSTSHLYTGHITKIGAIFEVFLLSVALGDRINNIRKTVIKAQEETIQLQKDFTLQLEHQVKERTEDLQEANKQLKILSTTDGLSQLYNRRYFDEKLNHEWHCHSRSRESLALILCDIDYFKMYNDTYGHQKGDDCIQSVAKILKINASLPNSFVARYGGEEFVIACPQCDRLKAYDIAEYIRHEIESIAIPHSESKASSVVSLSLGVAAIVPNESITPSTLISQADKALYQSKQFGRNRVTLAPNLAGE